MLTKKIEMFHDFGFTAHYPIDSKIASKTVKNFALNYNNMKLHCNLTLVKLASTKISKYLENEPNATEFMISAADINKEGVEYFSKYAYGSTFKINLRFLQIFKAIGLFFECPFILEKCYIFEEAISTMQNVVKNASQNENFIQLIAKYLHLFIESGLLVSVDISLIMKILKSTKTISLISEKALVNFIVHYCEENKQFNNSPEQNTLISLVRAENLNEKESAEILQSLRSRKEILTILMKRKLTYEVENDIDENSLPKRNYIIPTSTKCEESLNETQMKLFLEDFYKISGKENS
ncbi:hypothetical protein TRFO_17132 [Tritrichomonas foetus]|uniref:BTB domain-containing protein n=1 Tax=Tritrichomonas foetus TaxID=1144522 RepID=A0A1J4KPP2_9EUKA|nr:hypothetical protein TRFO_17132 [Tritrichomonas foetus]|eukprot:OHT12872.1 hypothetical protein TRFO_17132 [Tritrichomonas foetus]